MRTIKYFFYLLAAVALTGLASCQPEEDFKPGKPDNAQCVGVYFPKQDVTSEQQIFSPTDVKHDSIEISRSDYEDSLEITLKVSLSYLDSKGATQKADSNFFKVSNVKFEEGQQSSWVYLDFDEATEGVAYTLHLSIEGEEYSSNYSSNLKACDYKVMCVKYIDFVSPKDTTKPAIVHFYEGWWQEEHFAKIKYYEVDGIRHCITYDEEAVPGTGSTPDGGFWGQNPDVHFEFDWYVKDEEECDCGEGPHSCKVPAGYPVPEGAQIIRVKPTALLDYFGVYAFYAYDYYSYRVDQGGYARGFVHFIAANEIYDMASYYDKNGGFYFYVYGYTSATAGWVGAWMEDYDITAIAEGFNRADYSVKLTAGITQPDSNGNNVVPVAFDLGADVDKVGYTISKGALSGAQISKEAAAIAKDTIDYSYAHFVDAQGVSFSDSISVAETGIYTLVAVALDTAKKAKANASVTFHYLATGESNPVLIEVAANNTDAYVSKGYSPETSFEVTISGSGITGAIPMIYTQAEVEAEGGINAVVADIMNNPNVFYGILGDEDYADYYLSASQLADVNDKGYVDIYSAGVTPGTVYYVLVWATNGYDYTVAGDVVTTKGDPLPIYQKYTYQSRKAELIDGKSASDFFGTYNLYAIDLYGSASLRSYVGKSTLAAFDEAKYGPIGKPAVGEYVQISGLSCGQAPAGFDDTIILDFCENPMISDGISDAKGFFVCHTRNADSTAALYTYIAGLGDWYTASYFSVAYPVADGYLAFVAESAAGSQYSYFPNVNFYNASIDIAYRDFLLVDPKKDNNGLAPKTISKSLAVARKNAARKGNRVETPAGVRLGIQANTQKIVNNHLAMLEGVKGLKSTSAPVRVKASHNVSKAAPKVTKDSPLTYNNAKTRNVK